ncbi:hypothetical protein Osc7112_0580 [Oscillatoria nigro-viridis PCC 7112]|uniref:Lipoprotein n=1 Tax=Phormidium nigroviride PCC 7112 TaxID=179408 RepID=K9VAR0_9CYAN|nr:hypothetical protein [Oscillatoria nigro-viridis]AFZ05173.1 hypothetical protein Osc7112_0580 [Oscillatoria nigro-viridis PCC 7112]
MNQSIVKRSLFFLAVFACIQIPIAAMGQPAARSNYESINVKQFLGDRQITVSNPKDIAAKLFSSDTESEGRKSDQISVEYPTRETAVIVQTVVGLADDSVAGMRHRIELTFRRCGSDFFISCENLEAKPFWAEIMQC